MKSILKFLLLFVLVACPSCSDKPDEPDAPDSAPIDVTITLPENLQLTVGESKDIEVSFSVENAEITPDSWESAMADVKVARAEKQSGTLVTVTAISKGETSLKVTCSVKSKEFSKAIPVYVSEPQPVPAPGDGIMRVLAIGNSFSQDAVEQYLYDLAKAEGKEMIIGNMYIGGCNIDKHLNNIKNDLASYEYRKVVDGKKTEKKSVKLSYAFADEKWDYISLQQASGESGIYSTYSGLGELIELVSAAAPAATLVWHQTWAYASTSDHASFPAYGRDQIKMYDAIVDASRQAMSQHPALKKVIPSGTAIQNARSTFVGDIFNRDGYHLETTYGRYTAACTWFESLYGIDVTKNTYAPSTVSEEMGAIARASAHAAVQNPWSVTELPAYQVPDVKNDELTAPVYVDFGSGTPSSSPWNNVVSVSPSSGTSWLKDIQGNYVKANIEIVDGFTLDYKGVSGESNHTSIKTAGVEFPISAWKDAIAVSGTKGAGNAGPGRLKVNSLDPSKKYKLILLGVRYNGSRTARITEYKVTGSASYGTKEVMTGLKIGSGSGAYANFESVPFDEYVAIFENVTPASDGSVTIEVTGIDTGTAAEGHLNAMVLAPQQ